MKDLIFAWFINRQFGMMFQKILTLCFRDILTKVKYFPSIFLVKLKFKYIYGEYQLKNGTLFVSSGAGTWGPRMRLGSFNEILKINLSTQ